MKDKVRLGMLGCGEITRGYHLPAATRHPSVQVSVLVDSDVRRADDLRRYYGLNCKVTPSYETAFAEANAVINALPNRLHVPVTMDAFRAGVHVLCEKPLAITSAEARACCEAGAQKGLVLAVGMQRRFHASHQLLRLLLDEGTLGTLEGYEWVYGTAWGWETRSGFYFSRTEAGGGVLLDFGVHLLDCLVDWFGPVQQFEYQDDNWGSGLEANAILRLLHRGRYGEINGRVRLSRTYNLKNRMLLRGTLAHLEIPPHDPSVLIMRRPIGNRNVSMTLCLSERGEAGPIQPYFDQLDNFIQSIQGTARPVVNGWQALAITELVESCYARAQRIPEPWAVVPEAREMVGA